MKFRYIALLFAGCSLGAKEAQELFLEANQCYEQGQYNEALERYRLIENKGSAVYYNVGNALYHLGDYTGALVAYRRAESGASGAQLRAIFYNIREVQKKLGVPIDGIWYSVLAHINRVPFLLLQFLLILLWLAFLYYFWRWYEQRNYGYLLLMASLVILLVALVWIKYHKRCNSRAVVTISEQQLRVGPNEQFHTRGAVHAGNEISIVNQQAGDDGLTWYRVYSAQDVGWLPAKYVEVV